MEDSILGKFALMIGTDACPSEQEAAFLEAAYPYFVLPAAMRLANASDLSEQERLHLSLRVALASNAPDALFSAIDPDGKLFADFYPVKDMPSKPSTDSAIDTFLETYGKSTPEEEELLTRLIFNPVPEYAATLIKEDEEPPAASADEQDELLDAFLSSYSGAPAQKAASGEGTPRQPKPQKGAPKASEDSLLSESLAKIYISRGRYDKAYEIIHSLSLNFPKKSVYFADQLRFLQKLMLNSKFKDK